MRPEKFKEHIIFERLEQLKNRLLEDEVREEIDTEWLSFYDSAIDYIGERLRITIPAFIQESELNSLANDIQNALNHLNSFLGNHNTGYLTNTSNYLYTALNKIRNFPLPIKNKFNFSKEIANFETVISEKYILLEEKNEEINQKILEFESLLEEKQNTIEELEKLLVEKENQIEDITENFKSEFESIKINANQQFEEEINVFKEEIEEQKKIYSNEINELKNDISRNASELITELERKLDESKKLVNVIGNIGVTGNYQKIANYHKKQANLWRWIALGFMVLFTGLLIFSIYHITSGDFNWKVALVRILAFSALIYPAAYAARESSKHRKLEILNKKYELDLASINPFIEILPEEKKQEIKERLVDKFFGNNEGLEIKENKSNDDEISIGALEKIVKSILPFIKK